MSARDFRIRTAAPDDGPLLAELGARTFTQAFGGGGDPQNDLIMSRPLELRRDVARQNA